MNIKLLPQVLQDLIGEFNVEHRRQMRTVLYELLEYHLKNKYCMNCDYYYAEIKYTRDIFDDTYIFCSEWCQWDLEYDIRRNYNRY
jgi:hypothetical protein